MSSQDITDEEIIVKYLDGEDDALNLLIQRYIKSVYNFIYRYTKSPEASADTSLETEEDIFDSLLLHAQVKDAVRRLPPMYQNIISMKVDTGFTFEEMGEALGEPVNTIKSKHRRAIRQLRQMLIPIIGKSG